MNANLPPSYEWAEYPRGADKFWNNIRSVLINFVALTTKGEPEQLGTGFVIGVLAGGYVVVLTAKHVVVQGNIQARRSGLARAPNAPNILFAPELPCIEPDSMIALWMGEGIADVLQVKYLHYSDNLDLAVCILQFQEHARSAAKQIVPKVALDLKLPNVGDEIYLVALGGLEATRTAKGAVGLGTFRFKSRPVIRRGKVKSVEPESMCHKAPAFTTTIPVPGGMSGGFAYRLRADESIAACGIVSSSAVGDEDIVCFDQAGSSTIVGILGVLGLSLPTTLTDGAETLPILEFVHAGDIAELSGTARWLQWRPTDNGDGVQIYHSLASR